MSPAKLAGSHERARLSVIHDCHSVGNEENAVCRMMVCHSAGLPAADLPGQDVRQRDIHEGSVQQCEANTAGCTAASPQLAPPG
jgi:hypothetical protein